MERLLLLTLLLYCLFGCENVFALDVDIEGSNSPYSIFSDEISTSYSKLELSGCTTEITLNNDSPVLQLTYGECDIAKGHVESVSNVADSFLSIVKDHDLRPMIFQRKNLYLNFVWKVSHWPLIETANRSKSWPENIMNDLNYNNNQNRTKFIEEYKKLVEDEILKETAYLPFIHAMEKLGCSIALSDNFADPVFASRGIITRDKLIKWNVFSAGEVSKAVYPSLKGYVSFKYECAN